MVKIETLKAEDSRAETMETIKKSADEIIQKEHIPVITDKEESALAPSKNPHDYASLTHYTMSRTEEGNFDFKDGTQNPNVEKFTDSKRMEEARINLFFTSHAALEAQTNGQQEEALKYAGYSEQILSKWFIDEETRMTPNLEFASLIEGENSGNYFGIIEGDDLITFLDEADKLRGKGLIADETVEGMSQWFNEYLTWLTTSEKGLKEMEMENNHGTFYDAQVARIADFLGNKELVIEALDRTKARMAEQIMPNGEMPLEAVRKDSYGYQLYNLYGYSKLALVGERYDVDLWNYEPPNGGSLREAFEHFINTLPEESDHPIPEERDGQLYLTLRAAARAYKNNKYFDIPTTYFPSNTLADEVTKDTFGSKEISIMEKIQTIDGGDENEILGNKEKSAVMKGIFENIRHLIDTQANKFAAKAYENDFYSGSITVGTIMLSDENTYFLHSSLSKRREGGDITQSFIIDAIDDEQENTLYRLDIKWGDRVSERYKELLEYWSKTLAEEPTLKPIADKFLSAYSTDSDGKIIFCGSDWAETKVSDQRALEILTSCKELQFPQDLQNYHMQNYPSLERLRQQGNINVNELSI